MTRGRKTAVFSVVGLFLLLAAVGYCFRGHRVLGISALAAYAGSAEGTGLLYASSIIVIVASIIQLIAGNKGVGACSAPQKAASCIKWGIVIAVLSIISMIIGIVGGGSFSFTSLVLNLLVPGLYIYGAMQVNNHM